MMPKNGGQEPMKRGTVLDSGSGVSYVSEILATKLGTHFDGYLNYLPDTEERQGSGCRRT